MRRVRRYVLVCAILLSYRAIQAVRIMSGYARPIEQLSLVSVNTLASSALIVAPLAIYLVHLRFRESFACYVLVRSRSVGANARAFARGCAIDATLLVAAFQASSLPLVLVSGISTQAVVMAQMFLGKSVLLVIHYLFASLLYLGAGLLVDNFVVPTIAMALFLASDAISLYVTWMIQREFYLGWILIDAIFRPSRSVIESALHAVAVGIAILSLDCFAVGFSRLVR